MRRAAFAILLALTACRDPAHGGRSRAPADTAAGEVAFRYAGPSETAIVVPVTINGIGPFDFVLDTGATLSCIDQTLQGRLALPEKKGAIKLGAGIGQAGRFQLLLADTLRIGDAIVRELPVCVLDLRQFRALGVEIHGMVGLNFLREFRVGLDFERRVLTLTAP